MKSADGARFERQHVHLSEAVAHCPIPGVLDQDETLQRDRNLERRLTQLMPHLDRGMRRNHKIYKDEKNNKLSDGR